VFVKKPKRDRGKVVNQEGSRKCWMNCNELKKEKGWAKLPYGGQKGGSNGGGDSSIINIWR